MGLALCSLVQYAIDSGPLSLGAIALESISGFALPFVSSLSGFALQFVSSLNRARLWFVGPAADGVVWMYAKR